MIGETGLSKLIYIAGNYPLKEIKDPHIKTMSVNEALAAGVKVWDMLLQDEKLDRDEPDVILWMDEAAAREEGFSDSVPQECDTELTNATEHTGNEPGLLDDHFSISPFEKWEDILTKKTYCASLDWRYTKGRAARVVAYIKDYLQHTDEAEIWNIWMGSSYPPPLIKKIEISADELTPELLEKIDGMGSYQESALYKEYVPDEWDILEEELYPDTQYCFVVRAGRA